MFDLARRDSLEHRTVWIGAVLVAAVTSMFTTACLNALLLGATAPDAAFSRPEGREALLQTAGNLLLFSGAPAILVLATVLGTLVTQTRATHARWRLGGASPRQVLRVFTLQVILACSFGALAGALLALPFQGAAIEILGRGMAPRLGSTPGVTGAVAGLASMVLVSFWGVLAGLLPALRASRVSPLAAREPDTEEPGSRGNRLLAVLFVAFVQVPLLVPLLMTPLAESPVQSLVVLLPAGQALVITTALFAPFFLGRVIRAWTALPGLISWTPWRIARHMALTRAGQSSATITPLLVGVGLFACFDVVGAAALNVTDPQGPAINLFDGVLMLTPIGVIGAIGSAAVVFMASRQRTADLTTLRVAGASPVSSLAVFLCEAVVYVITALLVALVPVLGMCALLLVALARWDLPLDLAHLEPTGSVAVAATGGLATLGIVAACGLVTWRRPLATALADG